MEERYRSSMVLSAVGDAIGFKQGVWEFNVSGISMYEELQHLTGNAGVNRLCTTKDIWPVSDDTLLHKATAKALLCQGTEVDKHKLYIKLAEEYVETMNAKDMYDRAPGNTCIESSKNLARALKAKGQTLFRPFDKRGGGSGAAMRSMCIGLLYPTSELVEELVEVSIESGRLTHHHPTGYLGSMASALFTSYAVQDKPIEKWGKGLLDTLEIARKYIIESEIDVQANVNAMGYFEDEWKAYLKARGIIDGVSEPLFPKSYGLYERDIFYKSLSYDGTGGASGHDSPMIAYDALLSSGKDWSELCLRSMIHGGDSDTTGTIAGALYGAMFGSEGVPKINYEHVEFYKELDKVGGKLFKLSDEMKKARQPKDTQV